MSNLPLSRLLPLLASHLDLLGDTTFDSLVQFIDLLSLVRPTLQERCSVYDLVPLVTLPGHVVRFVRESLGMTKGVVTRLWELLRDESWKIEYDYDLTQRLGDRYIPMFLKHGPSNGLGTYVPTQQV